MAVEILARLAICGCLLVPLHPVSPRVVPVFPANHRSIRGRLVVDSSSPRDRLPSNLANHLLFYLNHADSKPQDLKSPFPAENNRELSYKANCPNADINHIAPILPLKDPSDPLPPSSSLPSTYLPPSLSPLPPSFPPKKKNSTTSPNPLLLPAFQTGIPTMGTHNNPFPNPTNFSIITIPISVANSPA